jgi:hypothetical protein
MGGFISKPSIPAPAPPPPVPVREDPEVQEAARRSRVAAANARGRGSTILTGELGVTGAQGTSGRPRLLGGGGM